MTEPEHVHLDDWQARVYVHADHVVKSPKTVEEITDTLVRTVTRYHDQPEAAREVARTMVEAFSTGRKLIRASSFPRWRLGNPQFLADGGYRQDRVTPCGAHLNGLDDITRHAPDLFRDYFDLIDQLWSHGLHEETLNMTCNAGVDAQGRVILIDFGEMMSSEEAIREELRSQRWRRSWTYLVDLADSVKQVYAELAEQRLTVARFDARWPRPSSPTGR